jgi:ABC-type uncharacterized transport system ATPase subunit
MSTEEAILIIQYNLEVDMEEFVEALEATKEIRMEILMELSA